MNKIKKTLLFVLILFLTFICLQQKVRAESNLYLNNLDFSVQINSDASMNVTEYWDIYIEETNTLYKSFTKDNTKYTGTVTIRYKYWSKNIKISTSFK